MKYDAKALQKWASSAADALCENGIEAVTAWPDSGDRAEAHTTSRASVIVWASGKVSAGGPQGPRDEALTVLSSADLVVGFRPGATGGMLLKMPEAEPAAQVQAARDAVDRAKSAAATRDARADATLKRVDYALEQLEDPWGCRSEVPLPVREMLADLRDLVALALGREVRK